MSATQRASEPPVNLGFPFRKIDALARHRLIQEEKMLHTRKIIEKIWDAQGYGNLAVWADGTTAVIAPGENPTRESAACDLKPIPLVHDFNAGFATHDIDRSSMLRSNPRPVARSSGTERWPPALKAIAEISSVA